MSLIIVLIENLLNLSNKTTKAHIEKSFTNTKLCAYVPMCLCGKTTNNISFLNNGRPKIFFHVFSSI